MKQIAGAGSWREQQPAKDLTNTGSALGIPGDDVAARRYFWYPKPFSQPAIVERQLLSVGPSEKRAVF
jgi:hypothetical protein